MSIKNILQKFINLLGYKISKIKTIDKHNLDEIIKYINEKEKPVIFDVGANKGQSIKRFKKMFKECTIHSFEPGDSECDQMRTNHKNDNSVYINNVGVGEKKEFLEFNINANTTHSSFKKLHENTTWIKKRSEVKKIKNGKFTISKELKQIITLDDYVNLNGIKTIDILKIDTQGYEDKVIAGTKDLIDKNRIKIIQLEIIFSEIYEKPLNIYNIEKFLIPKGYKLFGFSNAGSLASHHIFQSDFIYISEDTYREYKKKSDFFNND